MVLPKKLCHATKKGNYNKILAEGIKVSWDGCIYFSDTPNNAAKFLLIRGLKPEEIIVFEIPTSKLKKSRIELSSDHNVLFFKCEAWCYKEKIDAEKLLGCKVYDFTSKKAGK